MNKFFVYTAPDGTNYPVATDIEAVSYARLGLTDLRSVIKVYNLNDHYGRITNFRNNITGLENKLGRSMQAGDQVEFTDPDGKYYRYELLGTGEWVRCDSRLLESVYNHTEILDVSFSVSPTIVEEGLLTMVNLSAEARLGEELVTNDVTFELDPQPTEGWREETGQTKTYTLNYYYPMLGISGTRSTKVTAVKPSYFGIIEAAYSDYTNTALYRKLLLESRSTTFDNLNLNYQKLLYMYPSEYGELETIKDENGLDYKDSYMLFTSLVDGYNVYIMSSPVTITNFKQTYA